MSTGRITAASFGDQTDMILEQLLARVRDMASSGELWRQATPRDIILFWWGSTLGDEVRRFTSEATRTVDGLRSLLNVPVHPVYSSSGSYETVAPTWSEILDLEALTVGARKVLFEDRSDEHRRVAQRFLTAMENRERH